VNTASLRTALATCLVAIGIGGGCSAVDNRPAEWGYISPALFQPNCATTSCHSPAAAVSGLDFSTPDNGYTSLTRLWIWVVTPGDAGMVGSTLCANVNSTHVCEEKLRPLVTPFDPEGSRVVNMLRARDAPRMPPDRPLPEDDIRLVERWILNGACEFGSSCSSDAASPAGTDAARPPADAARPSADAASDRKTGD
jgi:hypothetical protein